MSELDELMDREAATYTSEDISKIIAWVRKQLAMYDSGGKPARPKVAEEIDMDKILSAITGRTTAMPTPAPGKKMKRRF